MPRSDADKFMRQIAGAAGPGSARAAFEAFVCWSALVLSAAGGDDREWLEERTEAALAALGDDAGEKMRGLLDAAAGMLDADPEQDLLGEAYTSLGLGDKKLGQFFTPYGICELMAALTADGESIRSEIARRGFATCSGPAAGCGAILIAAANRMRKLGINYQACAYFDACDIDEIVALACFVQMSLLGMAGRVAIGNTLTLEARRVLHTPMTSMHPVWVARALAARVAGTIRYYGRDRPIQAHVPVAHAFWNAGLRILLPGFAGDVGSDADFPSIAHTWDWRRGLAVGQRFKVAIASDEYCRCAWYGDGCEAVRRMIEGSALVYRGDLPDARDQRPAMRKPAAPGRSSGL